MTAETPRIDANFVHEMFNGWDKHVPSVDELRICFAEDLVFQDPLQKIHGIEAYWKMNEKLLNATVFIEIEMLEQAQTGNNIFFTYHMGLQPSARAPRMSVEGATFVQLDDAGKIHRHRDYWDFASTFTGAIPPLHGPWRWFASKFA